jgi:hypothetical protein
MIAVYIGYDVLIERSSRMVTKLVQPFLGACDKTMVNRKKELFSSNPHNLSYI